jgi:hypothetical protein
MTELTRGEFARYALICIAAGLMIGYGWALISSTLLFHVDYLPQTADRGASSPTMVPIASITQSHLTMTQGLEVLALLIIFGAVLGISARKIHEWNLRRLENKEKVKP